MMESTKERDAAIRKVKALLATGGFTEAEMVARAEKAQELLVKYKLQISDPVIRDNDFLTDRAAWIKPLLNAVARLYFCGYFYETFPAEFINKAGFAAGSRRLLAGSRRRVFLRHNFIGKQADIIVCKMMGEYLIEAMHTLCKQGLANWPKGERATFRVSFMNACAARLCHRLLQRKMDTSAGVKGTNLPALLSVYDQAQMDVQKFLESEGLAPKPTTSLAKIHHAGGAYAGMQAGDLIGLDQQVEGSPLRTRLN